MPNKPKPVLKSQKQQNAGKTDTSLAKRQVASRDSSEKKSFNIQSPDAKAIPLMFQAQIEGRGNIQYVGDKKDKTTGERSQEKSGYQRWVEQWLTSCPPVPEPISPNANTAWQRELTKLAVKVPEFGGDIHQWEYQIRWRLVMNSGQDSVIRPVIGKQGMPFFPGSSMKGAFRNACLEDKRGRYCGSEVITKKKEKRINPGILRFHGGYPINSEWRQHDRLVDIAHAQENYQVRDSKASHNANVQISLYRPKFRFGISSTETLTPKEWDEIQKIWEKALGFGIGSRISAGYGYVEGIKSSKPSLFSIHLNGRGITSQLLLPTSSKTPEFRPNMFKAALRGHTWRLLAGITDEETAQILTHKLWGGIDSGAVEGCIGIDFSFAAKGKLFMEEHLYTVVKQDKRTGEDYSVKVSMPIYSLQNGRLDLLQVSEAGIELKAFLESLVKFSMLLGGFGKSWRRVHHERFYRDYFKDKDKPMIGCHWEFANQSKEFYIAAEHDDLGEIKSFLKKIREQAIAWAQAENQPLNAYVKGWRETWHPDNVQVWGRLSKNGQSQAVRWFHNEDYLKGSDLAGKMGQIGRTWHRMYPRYGMKEGILTRLEEDYVELLTIFPDSSPKSQKFMEFLATDASGFQHLW